MNEGVRDSAGLPQIERGLRNTEDYEILICPRCIDPSYKLPDGSSRFHACPAKQSADRKTLELFREFNLHRL